MVTLANAQTSTATSSAADEMEALKQKIKEQDRRIEQLEAIKGQDQDTYRQIQREEILKILKEMKIEGDKHSDLRVFWKEGVRMETGDGEFKLHLGTRIQTDWAWFKTNDFKEKKPLGNKDIPDGAELRRLFLTLDGQIYKDLEFKTEIDFAGGTAKPQDIYVRMKNIPIAGNLTVGHFNEPYGMEQLTSNANTTFMERSLADAFAPGKNMGFMLNNAFLQDESKTHRLTAAGGFYRDTDDFAYGTGDGRYAGTFRLTGLPYYANKGNQLWHVGSAFSTRSSDPVRFRHRPEAHLAPYLVDTRNMNTDNTNLWNAETAVVFGPFHAEGEFDYANVNRHDDDTVAFNGWTGSAGYFLTGETRPYSTASGTWGRVVPKKNFRENGGLGAWEIASRYSAIDLNDQNVEGGRMEDVTVGLNWYLNPNVKVMWNYIHSTQNTWDTSEDTFMMRFQVDF